MQTLYELEGWSPWQNRRDSGYLLIVDSPAEAQKYLTNINTNEIILFCPEVDWSWSHVTQIQGTSNENKVKGLIAEHGTRVSRGAELASLIQMAAVLGVGTKIKRHLSNGLFTKIVCEGNYAIAKIYDKKIDLF